MIVSTYTDATEFLGKTQTELETNEAANSLMLGIARTLVNDPGRYETPACLKTVDDEGELALAALMTPPHKLVVYVPKSNIEGAARQLIEDLIEGGWSLPGVIGPSESAKQVAQSWEEITGGEYRQARHSRLFELREVIIPVPEGGRLRAAGLDDLELLTHWSHAFNEDIGQPVTYSQAAYQARARIEDGVIYLWEEGGSPVSMAMTTRPNRKGISVSLVYTPPELRRRGYATACVGELSRRLLTSGWEYCALFADVANAPANRVYERIGYQPILDFSEYSFDHKGP
jgi:predicted GNAT family acetyltransferase